MGSVGKLTACTMAYQGSNPDFLAHGSRSFFSERKTTRAWNWSLTSIQFRDPKYVDPYVGQFQAVLTLYVQVSITGFLDSVHRLIFLKEHVLEDLF